MLPWLMEQGEVPLAEVAARYDLTEAQVQTDLELVAMCGLPPFVDEMVDVFVDEGLVFVGVPRLFTRPLRLTAPEAFSLLASARAAMELPGADPEGPLGRGLAKLAGALADVGVETDAGPGDEADVASAVVIDLARPDIADELVSAAADGAELAISYYSPARDEQSDRTVVPRHVFAESGNWYLLADDDRSGQRRTFRIDRIESMQLTGRLDPTDDLVAAPGSFFDDPDLPTAVLRLSPAARWVVDQYPTVSTTECSQPAGWVEVELPVASNRWLARLLIRLGPDAVVVSPHDAASVAAAMASSVLDGYDLHRS